MTPATVDHASDKLLKKPDTAKRRTRLREFQAQLVERMQAARSGVDARINQLGVMIGQDRWLLNLQEAGEIISVGAITPVPLTHDWFLGLTNIRGNLISVIDFARFQGQAPTLIDKDCRIIAFGANLSFNSGVLVSRVLGLRNIAEMTLQADDHNDNSISQARRYIDRGSLVWKELELSKIVQDPRFLNVGL